MPSFTDLTALISQAQSDVTNYQTALQTQATAQAALDAAQATFDQATAAVAAGQQTLVGDESSLDALAHQLLSGAIVVAPTAGSPPADPASGDSATASGS